MRILLINQCFYPDVAATAQYASDLARQLAAEGHDVTVVSSRQGYADPRMRFPARGSWERIRILRVRCSGLGKGAKWRRATDFLSFLAACALRLAILPRHDVVIAMTTPPLVSALGALWARLRGARLVLWIMDLNPDQAIAAGWLRRGSIAARVLEAVMRFSLRSAERIVVLDRFMRERMVARGVPAGKIEVIPPWSHEAEVRYDPEGREAFRRAHGLDGRFVVMYSGNHSPCHPLDTLLEAAERLADDACIVFCFVGGGSEVVKVKRFAAQKGLPNVLCLPYQPLEDLSRSLSAADLHAVVMGCPFVGIVHPCKIYNVLRLGMPFLYVGPPESHVTDMLPPGAVGDWAHLFQHGDVESVARFIRQCAHAGSRRVEGEARFAERFSQAALTPKFVELLGQTVFPSETVMAARLAQAPSCAAQGQVNGRFRRVLGWRSLKRAAWKDPEARATGRRG